MSREVAQRELRNDTAGVLRAVEAGETLIVTTNGRPVAELRPIGPRRFVSRAVLSAAARTAPRINRAKFFADIDAAVDQSVDG